LQYVDGGASAGFVTGLGGAQRRGVRLDGAAQRLDARDLREHAEIRIARVVLGLARDPFDPLLGRTVQVDRLAHLRGHRAAGVDRKSQLQADRALVLIQGGAAGGRAVAERLGAVAGGMVAAAHQVERGEMSAARCADVFARDVGGQPARHQRKVLL